MWAVITSEFGMLGVITVEFCMLEVLTSKVRMLAVITGEIRMLWGYNWRISQVSSHTWPISQVSIVITSYAQWFLLRRCVGGSITDLAYSICANFEWQHIPKFELDQGN